MTAEELAAIHARCFTDAPPPWDAGSIAATLDSAGVFLIEAPAGFLIGRAIAGEAELLTVAVDPAARRQGTGRALCATFAERARGLGAACAFLEVAADNAPARALYAGLGWRQAGVRPRYYGPARDAIILRLALGEGQDSG